MEPKITFELGQKVRVKARLEVRKTDQGAYTYRDYFTVDEKRPLYGIVVGIRALKMGRTKFWVDEGYIFEHTGHARAVLVAVTLGRMVRALPEDLELEEEGDLAIMADIEGRHYHDHPPTP